jgi:protein-S-isoprenylcysteine O-methyltransferase Ste14
MSDTQKMAKILQTIFSLILLLVLFFLPAGTLNWPEAWIFIGLFLLYTTAAVWWMKKNDPELYRERSSRRKDIKKWDKKILFIYTLLLISQLIISGLDAVRFGWSHVPISVKILAFFIYVPAMSFGLSAMVHNSYLSQYIRIQEDRGHQVCSTGPYRWVRHPMYVGVIMVFLCTPLALGSLWSYIPAGLIIILFVIRTDLEDKTLQQELTGYLEYSEQVKYRLIPGIW